MKLNPDCIRDILITIEENVGFMDAIEIGEENYTQCELLKSYSYNEIGYHINQCSLSGFFTQTIASLDGSFIIMDLSPKAHDFLANIRSESNWKKIKEKATNVGSFSLNILSQIAVNYISSKIG